MLAGLGSGMLLWGTELFAKAQRKKIGLIAMFLQLGVQVSLMFAGSYSLRGYYEWPLNPQQ